MAEASVGCWGVGHSALVAETGRSQGGVHQALKALEGTGVIRSQKRRRTFYYTVNPDHAYAPMLQELFARERARDNVPHLFPTHWNHLEAVVSKLARAPEVQLVLLYGSLTQSPIRGQADVDLLVGTDGRAEPPEIGVGCSATRSRWSLSRPRSSRRRQPRRIRSSGACFGVTSCSTGMRALVCTGCGAPEPR